VGKGGELVAQVQEVWNKLNARERLTAIGAGVVILGWLVSIAGYGIGAGTVSLLGAIAVLVVLYLKYSPSQSITWPAPIPTVVLGISAIVALLAALDVLTSLRWIGLFGFGVGLFALILEAVGAALMVWGAWQEYQATVSTTSTSTSSAAAPSAPAPSAPAAPAAPAAPPVSSDTDDLPPA
jgi:hypothetical protein